MNDKTIQLKKKNDDPVIISRDLAKVVQRYIRYVDFKDIQKFQDEYKLTEKETSSLVVEMVGFVKEKF